MKLVEAIQQGESGTILEEPMSGSQQIDLNTPHQLPSVEPGCFCHAEVSYEGGGAGGNTADGKCRNERSMKGGGSVRQLKVLHQGLM